MLGLLSILLANPVTHDVKAGAQGQQSPAEQSQALARQEAERERWQNVGEIFDMLGLAEGSRVADVGAGRGFFVVRLASAVGKTGRVFAVDIDKKTLTQLRRRVEEASLENVEVIQGKAGNPKLPRAKLDAALIVDAYHEMKRHQAILKHIHAALKPGGRLLLVEPFSPASRKSSRTSQMREHTIAPELVEEDLRRSGFEIVARNDEFIEHRQTETYDSLILARRPRRVDRGDPVGYHPYSRRGHEREFLGRNQLAGECPRQIQFGLKVLW